jgi:hypothetical protein
MSSTFKNLDPFQRERLKNTLDENSRKLFKQNLRDQLKSKFINHEVMLNSIQLTRSDQEGANSTESVPFVLLTEPLADHKISSPSKMENIKITGEMKSATPIFYTNLPQVTCLPRIGQLSQTIDLPLQSDLYLKPAETRITDTGLQFYIPQGYYMHLIPSSAKYNLNMHIHHGIMDNDFYNTIKLF